jgi:hypothetical protein
MNLNKYTLVNKKSYNRTMKKNFKLDFLRIDNEKNLILMILLKK